MSSSLSHDHNARTLCILILKNRNCELRAEVVNRKTGILAESTVIVRQTKTCLPFENVLSVVNEDASEFSADAIGL
eukprot:1830368-Ditylum_brightwellii.AAC.1